MNRRSLSIIFLSLLLCLGFSANAQLDSRNRTPETIIADGLAQLPAKTVDNYNQVISEMAGTGQKGIEMLCGMLKPADKNKNATFEYAIDAIVSYATKTDNAANRKGIHDGLVAGLNKCEDPANKAFIMTQLAKVSDASDADLFARYFEDPYLKQYAVIGLTRTPGIEDMLIGKINAADAPDADLAYIAYFRKLKDTEPTLIKWTNSSDPKVLEAVYNALTTCGSVAAVKPLQKAAKAVKFANDPTGATDSYLQLLSNLDDSKTVVAAAKDLIKSDKSAIRCAGLKLLLNADKQNAEKNILAALKDKDIQYRNTALLEAQAVAGDGIFDIVGGKFNSLAPAAQADVIAWFGNNHAASQIDNVIAAIDSKSPAVAANAIAAASKIGGDKALQALISALGNNEQSANAANALLSFNGDIASGILSALDSSDASVVKNALALACTRHIYGAYAKAIKLMNSDNAEIASAALAALPGIVRPDNFNDLCNQLEAADKAEMVAKLQSAAANSIMSIDGDAQYNLINNRLSKAPSKIADRYYPLLAQSATQPAINRLLSEYANGNKAAAFDALLKVKNPAMIEILYDLAANNPDRKDAVINRYIELVKGAGLSGEENYRLYSSALDLQPSAQTQVALLNALTSSRTLPALMLASRYLDNKETALAAATTTKYIAAKEEGLQQGEAIKSILEKVLKTFVDFKVNDADAGYAADETTGILNNLKPEGGYAIVLDGKAASGANLDGNYENFEFFFDWNADAPAIATLRSMPLLTLDPTNGISYVHSTNAVPAKKGWNNIHVKMLNDRLFVYANGQPVAINETVKNVPADKEAPTAGSVSIAKAADNDINIRNFYFNHLPDTPIFTLSDEEKAQGFEVLFDGRSLEKWHGNTTAYVPVDGSIYVTAEYGGSGNLYTKKNYSDFIYRFEFYFDVPGVNNGIGIRTGKDVTGVDAAFHGMEIQVLDHDDPMYGGYPFGYTGIQPYQIHGSIYGVVGAKHLDFGPIKQWHTEEIKAIGDHITVTVDGEVIVDANIREACQGHAVGPEGTEGNPYMIDHRNHPGLFNKEGYISFCGHGQGVKFRNIRILDLSAKNKSNKAKKK